MKLFIAYNDKIKDFTKNIKSLCIEKYPLVEVTSYNEDVYKERRKAFQLKGCYSARMTPFMVLKDDNNKAVHAFYTEVGQCTVPELEKILNSFTIY